MICLSLWSSKQLFLFFHWRRSFTSWLGANICITSGCLKKMKYKCSFIIQSPTLVTIFVLKNATQVILFFFTCGEFHGVQLFLKTISACFHLCILSHSSSVQGFHFALILFGIWITASALILTAVCSKLDDLSVNKQRDPQIEFPDLLQSFRSVRLSEKKVSTDRCLQFLPFWH